MQTSEAGSLLRPARLRAVLAAHQCELIKDDGITATYKGLVDDVPTYFFVRRHGAQLFRVQYGFDDCDCD